MTGRAGRDSAAAAVADSFAGLLRTMRRGKARLVAGGDVESATELVLAVAAEAGPLRASALAADVGSDLSTVSRHVAELVAAGLLERSADPADGRACLLAVTEAGRVVLEKREAARAEFFAQVLQGWDAQDLRLFAGLLQRFAVSYDRVHAAWISERAVGGSGGSRQPARPA